MRLPETAVEVTEADNGDLFLRVLDQALDALGDAEIPFLLIGGIGSAVYGRDQGTRDIDVFVRPETARKVLEVLAERGFESSEHEVYFVIAKRRRISSGRRKQCRCCV